MGNCMVENGCMPTYSEDGLCLANDDQADQMITDLEQVSGDWWVLKGQNCGQDEVWYGGADWAPCQHGRFVKVDDGSWINNTTFCVGSDSTCISDLIVTIPKLSLVAPGVVRHDYPEGQAPIIPQIEDWKFMAMPDPDWALVIWCGSNPVLKYNGAFVISRHQSLDHWLQKLKSSLGRLPAILALIMMRCVYQITKIVLNNKRTSYKKQHLCYPSFLYFSSLRRSLVSTLLLSCHVSKSVSICAESVLANNSTAVFSLF